MSQEMKRCIQCGMLKDAKNFRPYTYAKEKNTTGRFRICRSCESINTIYKQLCKKLDGNDYTIGSSEHEMAVAQREQIRQMYLALEQHGLRTPLQAERERKKPVVDPIQDTIQQLTMFYAEPVPTTAPRIDLSPEDIPGELRSWLDAPMEDWVSHDLSPEYLQETIYESLKAKYRPQTGVDKETYLPIYDDTYKDVLNQILRRFDDYEEQYAGEPTDE